MLDITDRDIAELDDGDLRSLVAFLCEASLQRAGLPTSAVTWGGHQEAPDRGLDVRTDLPANTATRGYVPHPAIRDLAARGRAYVIASSAASLTDAALAGHRAAGRGGGAQLRASRTRLSRA